MSLLPDSASLFEQVQAFFLACRGDGACLSDADARCLIQWESTGAPAAVILRGIQNSLAHHVFEGKVVSRPRSLRSCRREVESEISKWRALNNSSGSSSPTNLSLNEYPDSPRETDSHPTASHALHCLAQNYSERRRLEAQFKLIQLCESLGLSPEQRRFLKGTLEGQTPGEYIRRAEDGAYIFALRNEPFQRRKEAVMAMRKAVGRREKLETPRFRALKLHDGLAQVARALLSKNPSRTNGQNR